MIPFVRQYTVTSVAPASESGDRGFVVTLKSLQDAPATSIWTADPKLAELPVGAIILISVN